MKTMKRIFITLCLMSTLSGFAQTWNIGSPVATGVTATLSGNTLTIRGTGAMKDHGEDPWHDNWYNYRTQITQVIIENGVTDIGNWIFSNCSNLVSIDIPESVTRIGDASFFRCINLISIDIPESVTRIESAFSGCSNLTSINIPSGVTSIESGTFYDCSKLTSIEIPENVISIGNSAFYGCSKLTSITIPENVTSIGFSVFGNCSNLASININSKNKNYSSDNGVLFNKDKTVLICCPGGKTEYYDIPNNVKNIEARAFEKCSSLTSITIPSSVTSIGNSAFESSGLTSIVIPKNVTSIGYGAFKGCTNLTELTLPFIGLSPTSSGGIEGGVSGDGTFSVLFETYKSIPSSLKKVTITEPCTAIKDAAFYNGCGSLTEINIPNTVASIGSNAFYSCSSLASITIPSSVTYIGSDILGGTAWYKNQPDGIIYINNMISTYKGTMPANTIIDVPNGVVYIADYAFFGCGGLIEITIPESVKGIGNGAFNRCDNLTTLNFNAKKCTVVSPPDGWKPDDWSPTYWENLTTINIGNTVKTIPSNAFRNCDKLTSIAIPSSVTSIGSNAFYGCSNLASVIFAVPSSITNIGAGAFYECSKLNSITIPEGVTDIRESTFNGCANLTSIIIPSVKSIGKSAFYRCDKLTSIINLNPVPANVELYAFYSTPTNACTVYVPNSAVAAYKIAGTWKDFNIVGGGLSLKAFPNNLLLGSITGYEKRFYTQGETVTLTAIPVQGASFINWTNADGEIVSNNADYSFSITDNIDITVNFIGQAVSVDIDVAGTLNSIAGAEEIGKLIITGNIDARDFKFMRNSMPSLTEIDLSGATIVEYIGSEGTRANSDYTYPANEIPYSAFDGKASLISVIMPSSVTSIGSSAFNGCSNLTSTNIPNRVTSIGYRAFHYCSSLTSIDIPSGVTSIGGDTFFYCNKLTTVTFSNPSMMTSIGTSAFAGCNSLTSINIPNTVTSIEPNAFQNCSNLTALTMFNPAPVAINANVFSGVNKTNCTLTVPASAIAAYQSADVWKDFNITGGGLSLKAFPNDLLLGSTAGYENRFYMQGETVNLTATPAQGASFINWTNANGEIVSNNADYSFSITGNVNITANFAGQAVSIDIDMAGTLNSISYAEIINKLIITGNIDARDIKFMRDNMLSLTELDLSGATIVGYTGSGGTISSNYTYPANEMPYRSFYNKASLISVVMPSSATSIGSYAFYNCSGLTSIDIPQNVTSIGSSTFSDCSNLTSINISQKVTSIESYVFENCSSLTSIEIPQSVTSIGNWAFYGCSSLATLNFNAINCSSTSYPTGWTNLTTVNIGEDVKVIPSSFLRDCNKVTSIIIPESVTSIGIYAFSGTGIDSITIPSGITNIGNYAFNNCTRLQTVNYNATNCTTMGSTVFSGSSSFTTLNIGSNVTKIPDNAFNGCNKLSSINIPNGVTSIGNYAFSSCSNFTSIVIPNSVTSIGNYAFKGCSNLSSINIPSGITSIGNSVFESCSNLTSIDIPNGITSIGTSAFSGCSNLVSIDIPNSVTSIGNDAFNSCSSLMSINIPNGITSIDYSTFQGCRNLTSINIPDGVTSIGVWAFQNCSSLTSIVIPNGVTSIGSSAFQNCSKLTAIVNLNPVPVVISSGVFSGVNKSACTLYVPAGSKTAYQTAAQWKDFNIVELPDMSEDDITVTPSDNSALIEWQPYEAAEGYRIIFYSDETHTDTLRILKFNADGLLIDSIIYRAKSVTQIASETYKYVFGNLLSGTDYYYTLEILGINNVVLASQSGEFRTTGEIITDISGVCNTPLRVVGYYNILGQPLPREPESGIYIIMYDNGKAEKVLK